MDKEDVSIEIASIRNALYHKNFLVAMTKLLDLRKMLKAWNLEHHVEPLIPELAKAAKANADTAVLEAKLKEIDVMVL